MAADVGACGLARVSGGRALSLSLSLSLDFSHAPKSAVATRRSGTEVARRVAVLEQIAARPLRTWAWALTRKSAGTYTSRVLLPQRERERERDSRERDSRERDSRDSREIRERFEIREIRESPPRVARRGRLEEERAVSLRRAKRSCVPKKNQTPFGRIAGVVEGDGAGCASLARLSRDGCVEELSSGGAEGRGRRGADARACDPLQSHVTQTQRDFRRTRAFEARLSRQCLSRYWVPARALGRFRSCLDGEGCFERPWTARVCV